MTKSKMKLEFLAVAAALACCLSACVEVNYELGGKLIPTDQTYTIYHSTTPITDIYMDMPDSLTGGSQSRVVIGAVRDERYGLSTRSSVMTLIPIFVKGDTLDFPKFIRDSINVHIKSFHFALAADTTSVASEDQLPILQNVRVYELEKDYNPTTTSALAKDIRYKKKSIIKGTPILNGVDSLSFDFTQEFADKYKKITPEMLRKRANFTPKFPGIYIETDSPAGIGGRINSFELQMNYDSSNGLTGNYAFMRIGYTGHDTDDDGNPCLVEKDSIIVFLPALYELCSSEDLLGNYSRGSYPQYALNLSTHETWGERGRVTDEVKIEGGSGLTPKIKATELKAIAKKMICKESGLSEDEIDWKSVSVNKATLVLPFEFPEDYKDMDKYPIMLSPTTLVHYTVKDTETGKVDYYDKFMGLTDASSEDENQGTIDRYNLQFAPDITYHMQEILKKDDESIEKAGYDIWFFIMAYDVDYSSSSSSSSSSDLSEYYQYLAYQNYYNSMYSGSYYGSSYSNYYSYMLASMYASSSSTSSVSYSLQLDVMRYYNAWLNGPESNNERKPYLKMTYSIPNKAE